MSSPSSPSAPSPPWPRSTERVRLGQVVICTAFRNPALTAKMIGTLDVISGGRMELGIGAGWKEDEWRAYGYGFPDTKTRLATLSDHLEVITRMLAPGHATFAGTYASVTDAVNVPRGLQEPRVPIMVGGNGPKVTWRLAARHADELNLDWLTPDEVRDAKPVIASRCEEIGRDPATPAAVGEHQPIRDQGRRTVPGGAAGRLPRGRRRPGDGPAPGERGQRRAARVPRGRRTGRRLHAGNVRHRMIWRVLAVMVGAVVIAGLAYVYLPYVGWNNSEADARARTEAYLAAVVGGREDRGWRLLEASSREAYGSEESYRRLMAEADWSEFRWELRHDSVCDDGVCSFILRMPNGRTSAPEAAWSDGPGDPGFLVSTAESTAGARRAGEAFIGVLQRGWFGGIGVMVSGVGSPH